MTNLDQALLGSPKSLQREGRWTRSTPGIQYVVASSRGVIDEVSCGVADAATGAAMTPDVLQMGYSTTKAITAIAVMQLVERGAIELDSPLDRYFSDHPYGADVTIRTLLAQTSGVPNPMPLDWFWLGDERPDRPRALAALLAKHAKLTHPPGAKLGYSNLSYWLLEEVIQRVSGQDYADYVAAQVFARVGVERRHATFDPSDAGAIATGHGRRFGLTNLALSLLAPRRYWIEPARGWSRVAALRPKGRGYGGLFATARALGAVVGDLLRSEPRLMSGGTRDAMFEPQRTRDGARIDMSLGWVVGRLDGHAYLGKPGGGLGFHGSVRVYPGLGVATAFLANGTEVSARPIDAHADRLDRELATGRAAPPAPVNQDPQVSPRVT